MGPPRRVVLSSPGIVLLVLANGGLGGPRKLEQIYYRASPSQSTGHRPWTDQDVVRNNAAAIDARGLGSKAHLGDHHLHEPAVFRTHHRDVAGNLWRPCSAAYWRGQMLDSGPVYYF